MNVKINNKSAKIKMDMGTVKKLKKEHDINFLNLTLDKATDPDVMTTILLTAAQRGGSDITMEDIDTMPVGQFIKVQEDMEKLIMEFYPEGDKSSKNPKSRQS